MPLLSPFAPTVLLFAALLVYIGLAHRVLDRMRLSRRAAGLLVLLMGLGTLAPELPLGPAVSVDVGGALIPLGVAVYLMAGADQRLERRRALVATAATAALIYLYDVLLPIEPFGRFDLDPVYVPGVLAGITAYLLGRSRRAAFVAGVGGVIIADLAAVGLNVVRGVPGALVAVGGAGLIDAVVVAGILAVLLAEGIGESREWLARRGGPGSGGDGGQSAAPQESPGTVLDHPYATLGALALSLVMMAGAAYYEMVRPPLPGQELPPGAHLAVVNAAGEELTQIGRQLQPADLYVGGDGTAWRVAEVTARQAIVEAAQKVDGGHTGDGLLDTVRHEPARVALHAASFGAPPQPAPVAVGPQRLLAQLGIGDVFPILENGEEVGREDAPGLPAPDAGDPARPGPIGVYHAHNAESYVVGDGTSSLYGKGGIHQVGRAFSASLMEQRFEVIFDESLHLPHDRGAYRRARRTVANLLREQPVALFDIHRDATPPDVYAHRLEDGSEVTRVRLVVGLQHANVQRNMAFAQQLKRLADEMYPGLVLDIFGISGAHFNQDVGRHSLLLEVGAHTNARAHAEEGARRFAEVAASYFTPDE